MILHGSGLLVVCITCMKSHTHHHFGMDYNRKIDPSKVNAINKEGGDDEQTLSAWQKLRKAFWNSVTGDKINSDENGNDNDAIMVSNTKPSSNKNLSDDYQKIMMTPKSDDETATEHPFGSSFDFDKDVTNFLGIRPHFSLKSTHSSPDGKMFHGYTDIRLCRQLENWDCGVACLQMILRWLRETDENSWGGMDSRKPTKQELIERDWILQNIGVKSIWTIDLVMMLQTLIDDKEKLPTRMSFLFCSTKLGVDVSHGQLAYYKNAFQSDEYRVNDLFHQAKMKDLPIRCISKLELSQVINIVSDENNCVAIVLLDNQFLNQRYAKSPLTTDNQEETSKDPSKCTTYSGHYVILCGISSNPIHITTAEKMDEIQTLEDYCVVIKNPARSAETDYVTTELFTKAWRAEGTDEDIIFIAKHD